MSPTGTMQRGRGRTFALKLGIGLLLAVPVITALWSGGRSIAILLAICAGVGAGEFFRRTTTPSRRMHFDFKLYEAGCVFLAAGIPLIATVVAHKYWIVLVFAGMSLFLLSDQIISPWLECGAMFRTSNSGLVPLEGAFYLGGTLGCLVPIALLPHGSRWLLVIALLNVVSDSFSQICGQVGGFILNLTSGKDREKVFLPPLPRLSPSKTRIGFIGGALCTIGIGMLYGGVTYIWLAMAIAVSAPAGDLLGSAFKRGLAIKDWSTWLGPHGGLGDRLDSFTLTAPAAFIVMTMNGVLA
jgi:CDP-diglyceride synthetase